MNQIVVLFVCVFSLQGLLFAKTEVLSSASPFEQAIQSGKIAAQKTETTPQAAAPDSTDEAEPTIYLNFENASLASVINYLAERKNYDIIPHKELQNIKVSLTSRKPMTLTEAWNTMHTLLEANGFAIMDVDGLHRVVPLQEAQRNPMPCFSSARGVTPAMLPDTDEQVRYMYFCKNIKSGPAKSILEPLLSPNAVQVNPNLEVVIITDKSLNIKSVMRIIEELDQGGLRETISILQLKHTTAEAVAKIFNEQILDRGQQQQQDQIRFINPNNPENKQSGYFSSDIKLIPEPIQNKLFLLGTAKAIATIVDFINNNLDVPMGGAESRIHVKEIKYMAADAIKDLLNKMIQAPRSQQGKSSLEGDFRYFEDVIIVSESSGGNSGKGTGNRLIISCNKDDWQRLSSFIDQLDKPQPQVALEVLIADLNADDTRALGAQLRSRTNLLGQDIAAQGYTVATPSDSRAVDTNLGYVAAAQGAASILTLGDATTQNIWAVIRSVYKIDHSNIISQPYMVANNNTTCRQVIAVTKYVPGDLSNSNSSLLQVRKMVPVPAEVSTEITPRINASGTIELSINIKVDEFSEISDSQPNMRNRLISTGALMATGEVLVIGGLTSSRHSNSGWSVPILSSIPIIGNLFKDTSSLRSKKSLYIFIRPSILRPHFEGEPDDYTGRKLDYARHQILSHDSYASNMNDPIQRYFFRPGRTPIKQKLDAIAAGKMVILDDFIERREIPKQVHISKDPYFRPEVNKNTTEDDSNQSAENEFNEYNPLSNNLAMPHFSPGSYITPGLIEASLPQEILQAIATSPQGALQPAPLPGLQRRDLSITKE